MLPPKFSFMQLVKKTGTLAKSSRSKRIDPLTLAKNKVLAALKVQQGYVALVAEDKPLPKKGGLGRPRRGSASTTRGGGPASATARCLSRSGRGGQADMLIGSLEEVAAFYDAVTQAIGRGELDAQILKLQTLSAQPRSRRREADLRRLPGLCRHPRLTWRDYLYAKNLRTGRFGRAGLFLYLSFELESEPMFRDVFVRH